MSKIEGVVYDPPKDGFPHLAVIFDPEGEVLISRSVPSREVGEQVLVDVFNKFVTAKNG